MKNGFTTHQLKTEETLGERLKRAREEANLTLKEVSQSIRVREIYLDLLENGRYNELPPDVYIKGFLKSYCHYIGLEYKHALNLYQRERGIQENIKKSKEKKPLPFKNSSFVITPRIIKVSLAVIVIISLFLYIWLQISGLSKPPVLTILDPSEDKTIKDDIIVLYGETQSEVDVTVNDQPIQVDSAGKFKETIALQEGLNSLKIVANNKFGKTTEVKRNIMVELPGSKEIKKEPEKPIDQKEAKKNLNKKELDLVISVKERTVWVQIKSDENIVYSGMMLPDSSQVFKAKEKFLVSSDKPSKTQVTLNGKDLGMLDNKEEMVRDKEIK